MILAAVALKLSELTPTRETNEWGRMLVTKPYLRGPFFHISQEGSL